MTTTGGNTGNVIYTWNTGQILNIYSKLSAAYVVIATDVLGCMDTTDYTITEPDQLETKYLVLIFQTFYVMVSQLVN